MSIWTQLEQDSRCDIELLNAAMALLAVIGSSPKTEAYMRAKIAGLEERVSAHRKRDHRFRSSAVAFDMREYPST